MKKIPDGSIASQSLNNMPVFAIKEGQNVGTVRKVLVNGENKLLFLVEDEEWFKGGKVVRGCNVTKIGKDALVIDNKDKLVVFNDPKIDDLGKCTCLREKMALKEGKQIGKIKEYSLDRDKVEIVDIEVLTDEKGDKRAYFPVEEVADVTADTVVFKEPEQAESDEAVVETEGETEPEGLITETEEKVTASGSHPEEVVGRREDLSKKASTGNGEEDKKAQVKEDVKEAVVEEATAVAGHKDLKEILEERQDKFLLGKKVDRDITADDGTIIIKKGETITKEVLEEAKKAHKYIVLSFCVKTDLIKRS